MDYSTFIVLGDVLIGTNVDQEDEDMVRPHS